MLRPTESPVVFLQQLGRGLRTSDGKEHLQVIDFIGNHRSFLLKPRALLALAGRAHPSRAALRKAIHDQTLFDLPEGCSVTWELDAVELFDQLLTMRGKATNALVDYVRDHIDETGARPTAVQAFRSGLNVGSAAKAGGWFGLLYELDALERDEADVVVELGGVLAQMEKEPLTRAYKLVTLRALLHDQALERGLALDRLALLSRQIIAGDPRLSADALSSAMDPESATESAWLDFWERNPIAAWTATGKRTGPPLFHVLDGRFAPTFEVRPALVASFEGMVEELVEYRLARYLARPGAEGDEIVLKVSHADGRPIVFLDRDRHPETPNGWTEVIADGRRYELNFVKVAVNVARTTGQDGNALHGLLRGWFGESAGRPGTDHRVALRNESGRWTLRPASVAASVGEPVALEVDGSPIDARVLVGEDGSGILTVTFESAGGTRGSAQARNLDYVRGVDLVLERAQHLGHELVDAYIDTTRTTHLTLDERRLDPGPGGYPVSLTEHRPEEVRRQLLRSMAAAGRSGSRRGGGNSRKRMTIVLRPRDSVQRPSATEMLIAGKQSGGPGPDHSATAG